jgi:hypothetical protein
LLLDAARRALNQLADDIRIDRLIEEAPAGNTRVDRFENVHIQR